MTTAKAALSIAPAATRPPSPTRGVATAAPAVETVGGPLEEGWSGAPEDEGTNAVVLWPDSEWEAEPDGTAPEDGGAAGPDEGGATGPEVGLGSTGRPLLAGGAGADAEGVAGGAGGTTGAEAGGAGGTTADDTGGAGGPYGEDGAGRPEVAQSLTVMVTVAVAVAAQASTHISLWSVVKLQLRLTVVSDNSGSERDDREELEAEHVDSGKLLEFGNGSKMFDLN